MISREGHSMTPVYVGAGPFLAQVRKSRTPLFPLILACLVALSLVASLAVAQAQPISEEARAVENSIIKIYTTSAAPDYFTPWRLLTPSQSSGSGTVISGNRILTNAHVVANASYIQVQKYNDPTRYTATVEFVSHASDLAL